MLVLLAQLRGIGVVTASDAPSAEQILESDGSFDVVVLDFNLGGGHTAEPLVQRAREKGIPPVVVTGNPRKARAALGSETVIVTKPFSIDDVLALGRAQACGPDKLLARGS